VSYLKPTVIRAAVIGIGINIGLVIISAIGINLWGLSWLVAIATGALAVRFALELGPVDLQTGAIDGAVAGALAAVIGSLISLIVTTIFISSAFGGMGFGIGIGAWISGLIMGIIIGAILGGIGGGLYVYLKDQGIIK
jgi:hypothetical protein